MLNSITHDTCLPGLAAWEGLTQVRIVEMNLQDKANEIRLRTFESIYSAGGGHYGGSLSAIEILTCLYYRLLRYRVNEPGWPERDIFILAKGHAGPPLYTILADCGFFDPERLKELDKNGGTLPKHVDRKKVEGIEYSSGPLGQGLSVAVGAALASRLKNCDSYTYVLTGDGELDEGQVWEAAMFAGNYKLSNLCWLIDFNGLQIDGANDLVIFLRIELPLQGALIATFTLFTAVGYWNEWFWSTLLINSGSKMTLQVVLKAIVAESAALEDVSTGEAGMDAFAQGIKMAAVMLTMVPIMCLYPFLQKYFVKGVLVGSVKM